MKLKFKKILLTALVAASVFCVAFSVPAAAATGYNVSSVTVGGKSVSFTSIPFSATSTIPYSGVRYSADGLNAADFFLNTHIALNKGDTVSISYTVLIVHIGQGFSFFFGLGGARFTPPLSDLRLLSDGAHPIHCVSSSVVLNSASAQTLDPFFEVSVNGNTGYDREDANLILVDFSYSINGNPAVAANEAANDIKNNQDKNTQKQIDEDYGYQKPDSSDTDEGISSGTNLIESLNKWIDDFNKELPTSVSHIMDDIQPFKQMVHKMFNIFPVALQYLFVFAMVFLVLRKVVGR